MLRGKYSNLSISNLKILRFMKSMAITRQILSNSILKNVKKIREYMKLISSKTRIQIKRRLRHQPQKKQRKNDQY
jgi:hypothetical protein